MPLIPAHPTAYGKKPTAIKPATFQRGGSSSSVEAIWLSRKNGLVTSNLGKLHLYWDSWHDDDSIPSPKAASLEEAMSLATRRVGYFSDANWTGERLWTTHKFEPEKEQQVRDLLLPVQATPGHLPEGYQGWYTLTN